MKTEFVGLRLEAETVKAIKEQAVKEDRSKSNIIQLAIKQYLASKKESK